MLSKQVMTGMLKDAKEAVDEAGLNPTALSHTDPITEGTQNLIGQLIMAAAIEESGRSIATALNNIASRIRGTSR